MIFLIKVFCGRYKTILSKPFGGWTGVTIGYFNGRASYITDVPIDCLISFVNALEYNIPASVFFNEEGSEFTLVSSLDGTYVISERETTELFSIDINILDLAKELVFDIENNLEYWLVWINYYKYSENELIKRRSLISDMLEKLKELIRLKENNFK